MVFIINYTYSYVMIYDFTQKHLKSLMLSAFWRAVLLVIVHKIEYKLTFKFIQDVSDKSNFGNGERHKFYLNGKKSHFLKTRVCHFLDKLTYF